MLEEFHPLRQRLHRFTKYALAAPEMTFRGSGIGRRGIWNSNEAKPRRSHQWMASATHAAWTSSVLRSTNFYQKFIKFSYKVAAPTGL